ncbi:hypothetical protein KFE25_007397 [Diacronema lutheri]|uniref:Uncharacterized protein n=2 Tax=Diacronema lutheri TaxID=2081491 RepID=A0A8J6CDR6_DIALT|nr:hypothetical protein KFE25_007397 [Diacronema lutheri]
MVPAILIGRMSAAHGAALTARGAALAARAVWSEAAARDVEHARLRALLADATVCEERTSDGSWELTLRSKAAPSVALASLEARAPDALMRRVATHEALPMRAALPLVEHALSRRGARAAIAALPGLCAFVEDVGSERLVAEFGDEAGAAVLAVALGQPRPGHRVLGQGTFRAAQPAWAVLAARFAGSHRAEEAALFRVAGLTDWRVQPLADMSPARLAESGGAVVLLALPGELPRHQDEE